MTQDIKALTTILFDRTKRRRFQPSTMYQSLHKVKQLLSHSYSYKLDLSNIVCLDIEVLTLHVYPVSCRLLERHFCIHPINFSIT